MALSSHYQKTKRVDYAAVKKLCEILNAMSSLKSLHFTIPVEPSLRARVDPFPGLYNAVCWHANAWINWVEHKGVLMRGEGWNNSGKTSWVRDLLRVSAGGITDFRMDADEGVAGGCYGRESR